MLQQSSCGLRKLWLFMGFMNRKDGGHSKSPGQVHGHGTGCSRSCLFSQEEPLTMSPARPRSVRPLCLFTMTPAGIPARLIHHHKSQWQRLQGKSWVAPWKKTSGTFKTIDELDCRNKTDSSWGSPRDSSDWNLSKGSWCDYTSRWYLNQQEATSVLQQVKTS